MFWIIDWNVDPIIFKLGAFELRWYGLLFATGFIIGYQIMKRIFIREGISLALLESLLMYLVIGTIVGARLGHCIFYEWAYYQNHLLEMILPFQFSPEIKFTAFSGLASHGGAIAILIMLWIYAKRIIKKPFIWLMDRVMIPVALVGTFIRLGNLINHEIIGIPTDKAWAFVFNLVDKTARHPAQLYESFSYLIIFFFLMYLYWKRSASNFTGRLFGWFLLLLWGARFMVEYVKKDQGGLAKYFGDILTTGQLLSIPFIIAGIILIIRSYLVKNNN